MKGLALVFMGGGLGAAARYTLGGWILHHTADWRFPLGTFVVNALGCLAAGILAGLAEKHDLITPEMRLFLFTGVLGGFTTFSAFGMETVYLLQRQEFLWAGLNVLLSVSCGLLVLGLGIRAVP